MKSLRVKTTVWALSALWLTGVAAAQSYPNATYGSPSLLPLPSSQVHRATPAAHDSMGAAYNTPPVYQPNPAYPPTPPVRNLYASSGSPQHPPQHELPAPQHAPSPIPQLAAPRGEYQPYENVPSHSDAPSAGYGNGYGHGHAYDQDPGCGRYAGSPYEDAATSPWAADGGCGVAPSVGGLSCFGGQMCNWFGAVNALVMNRDEANHFFFSYGDGAEELQELDARGWDWAGGFETRFGRYFGCGAYAVEAAYWGLYPGGEQSVIHDYEVNGALNGIFNWNSLDYNGGTADLSVNNAVCHRLRRNYEVHNVELNLLKFPLAGAYGCGAACGPKLNLAWLCGLRFFKFDESLEFASDPNNDKFTHGLEEIYYNVSVKNNLIGFQMGGLADYCLCRRVSLNTGVTLGVYGNHIEHYSRIGGASGDAVINNGPNAGRAFRVSNSKADVAFLGEAKLGLRCHVTSCCSATLGYRAVAATGVALTANQIYPDLRGIQDVGLIDSNGSLILHGAYAGVEFNY